MSILDNARRNAMMLKKKAEQKAERIAREFIEREEHRPVTAVESVKLMVEALKNRDLIDADQEQEYCNLYKTNDLGLYPNVDEYIEAIIDENKLAHKVKLVSGLAGWHLYYDVLEYANKDTYVKFNRGGANDYLFIVDMPRALQDVRDAYQEKEDAFNDKVKRFKQENKDALDLYDKIQHAQRIGKELDSMIWNHENGARTMMKISMVDDELVKLEVNK